MVGSETPTLRLHMGMHGMPDGPGASENAINFLKESDARLENGKSAVYVVACVSWQIRFVCMNQLSTHSYSRRSCLRSIPLQAGHL